MKRPPGRGRNIWTDAKVEKNGLGHPLLSLAYGNFCPSLSGTRLASLSLTIWVPLLCSLPPQDGLIPVTSTEAPVMYPLASDAKNATTSATSMGIVERGHNPTHSYRPKWPSPPPSNTPSSQAHTETTNPGENLSDTTDFGISSLSTVPHGLRPHSVLTLRAPHMSHWDHSNHL